MTDDLMLNDPFIKALCREQVTTPGGYSPPEDVATAQKALRDLLARTEGRDRTRDEKRLAARYRATVDAHHAAITAKHSETAPTSKNGAPS